MQVETSQGGTSVMADVSIFLIHLPLLTVVAKSDPSHTASTGSNTRYRPGSCFYTTAADN